MKRIFLLNAFLLCSLSIFSQNWRPLNSMEVFNFQLDNDNVVSASIWVDSTQQVNGDSVFYLNRIVKQLDDCITLTNGVAQCSTCCYGKNEANFLQRQVTLRADGSWLFDSPDRFVLLPHAGLNDAWLMDTVNTITATVSRVYSDSVFGNPDSLKTLSLTGGDSLIISKAHGVLKYPNGYGTGSGYALIGIEGRNLGEVLPGFWEMFDFQVGDQFEVIHGYNNGGPQVITNTWREKFSINSRTQSGDSLTCSVSGISRFTYDDGYGHQSVSVNPNFSESFTVVDSTDHLANKYPGQAIIHPIKRVDDYLDGPPAFILPVDPFFPLYDYVALERDMQGRLIKKLGYADQSTNPANLHPFQPGSDILVESNNSLGIQEYTEGLGTTWFDWWDFESTGNFQLVAYAKAGQDTVGVFTTDSTLIFVGLEEGLPTLNVRIGPNPAQEQIHIQVDEPLIGTVDLLSIHGQLILQTHFSGRKSTLDLGNIPAGCYFLSLETDKGKVVKKILLQ